MAARLTTYVVVGIVAATLIAGLIVGAQRDDNDGPVDLIVYNAKVYTSDGSGTMADSGLHRGRKLGECFLKSVRNKDRVVTKTAFASNMG